MPRLMMSLLHITMLFSGVDARRKFPSVYADGKNGTSGFSALQQESEDVGVWDVWDLPKAKCHLNDDFMGSCATGDTSFEEDWKCMECPKHLHTSLALEYQHRFWGNYWGEFPLERCNRYNPRSRSTSSVNACDRSKDVHLRIKRKWFDFTETTRYDHQTDYSFQGGHCKTQGLNEYPPFKRMSAPGCTGDTLDAYCRKSCDMDFGKCIGYETHNKHEKCTTLYMLRADATIDDVFYRSIIWDPVHRGDNLDRDWRCWMRSQEEAYSPPVWMLYTGFFDDIYAYLVEDYRTYFNGDCDTLLHRTPSPFKRPRVSSQSTCRDQCDDFWESCVAYSTNGGSCKLYEYMMVAHEGTELWNPITRGNGDGGWRCWVKTLPFSPPGMAFDWGVSDLLTW